MADQGERRIRQLVSSPLVVVGQEACLRAAAQQLETAGVTAGVVGHTRDVVGIVSEHNLAEAMARAMDPEATPVHAVMTPYFSSVEASSTVDAAKLAARSSRAHVLAVTDGGQVVGLVTTEDVLREPSSTTV